VSIPESARIQVLDLAGKGDEVFANAIRDLKHDIFLGIRGAVLQSLEGTISDARGNSQAHQETSELIDWYLSSCLLRVFNDRETGLIKDVCDLNFNCSEYPKATLSAIDLSQLEIEARIDAVLHTFLPLSLEETYERYNRTPPRNAHDVIPPSSQQQGQRGGTRGDNEPADVEKFYAAWDPAKHPRGGNPKNRGEFSKVPGASSSRVEEWAKHHGFDKAVVSADPMAGVGDADEQQPQEPTPENWEEIRTLKEKVKAIKAKGKQNALQPAEEAILKRYDDVYAHWRNRGVDIESPGPKGIRAPTTNEVIEDLTTGRPPSYIDDAVKGKAVDNLAKAAQIALDKLPPAIKEKLTAKFTGPELQKKLAALAIWALAQTTPPTKVVADVVFTGLLAYWGVTVSSEILGKLAAYAYSAVRARNEGDLQRAADFLADGLSTAVVEGVDAAVTVGTAKGVQKGLGALKGKLATTRSGGKTAETSPKPESAPEPQPKTGAPSKWINPDGSIRWPANDGFEGVPEKVTLKPGTRIDRYGHEGGYFVSPEGTPVPQRSLAPESEVNPYHVYEVVKPIDAAGGKTAKWFDQPGGGKQYKLGKRIKELLAEGSIKEVVK
jgi:hypothetical protein